MEISEAEIERRMESFRAAVRRAGVKLTPQRLEIFREVAASQEHPSAEVVHRAVRERLPMVSLDTVYRTLWTLSDLGLLHALGPRHESVRFDANLGRHHHFECERCGLVRDFESAALDGLRVPAAARRLGRVLHAHVVVRGLCVRCAGTADTRVKGGKAEELRLEKGRNR